MSGPTVADQLAACPHYSVCGGCFDLTDKADILPASLRRAGFDVGAVALAAGGLYQRRRMELAFRRAGEVVLGLHRHRGHDIVDLTECRVLHPELARLLPGLRAVLGRCDLLRRQGSLLGNLTLTGADILLRGDQAASRADRARLAAFAGEQGIARISGAVGGEAPETLAQHRVPELRFAGHAVVPPPGGFLQATEAGEAAIRDAVLAGLPKAGRKFRIAELYAGCGTLSFALAEHAVVDAYEGDMAAHAALAAACRGAMLSGRINPMRRDLARQPLMPDELARIGCLVLDPPQAGAPAQMAMILAATEAQRPARVIMVSCDPEGLARDAGVLRRAGYGLVGATAIDQFIGTPRVESVSVFGRGK